MQDFFGLFFDFWAKVLEVLNSCIFVIYGYSVSLFHLLGAFLVVSICITLFWKGGKA